MTIYSDPLFALAEMRLRQEAFSVAELRQHPARPRTSHRQPWFLRSRVRPALRPAHGPRPA